MYILLVGRAVYSVCFSPDGKQLVSGSAAGTVRLWDVETGNFNFPGQGEIFGDVWSVCYSPDGTRLASGCEDYLVRLWLLV